MINPVRFCFFAEYILNERGEIFVYSILLGNDNTLTPTTTQRVMQRSKLVDSLRFVVPPIYEEQDMSLYTVRLEYVLPVSREKHSVILNLNDELFEDCYVYVVPFDTNLTAEAGDIEMWLTFTRLDMDEAGVITQYVRKTSACFVTIIPVSAWFDFVPDEALSAVDQRILATEANIKALADMQDQMAVESGNKADGITYNPETNKIQLVSNGKPIGEAVDLTDLTNADGIPTVEFDAVSTQEASGFRVVEF